MYCLQCNQETINPKFCSRSCNAKYFNKQDGRKKRDLMGQCKICSEPIKKAHTFCKEHRPKYIDWDNATIAEAQTRHKQQFYNRIRELSRRKFQKQCCIFTCQNCGYDKFVEVCHIHAISSYPKETLVSVVNADDNVILLCPNCHWEFDNGSLDIDKKSISHLEKVDYRDCVCKTCKRSLKNPEPIYKKLPSKEQLQEDLLMLNNSAISRKYGVTPKTVRKWIVRYQLE